MGIRKGLRALLVGAAMAYGAGSAQAATVTYETFAAAGGACSLANGNNDVTCDGSGAGYATLNVQILRPEFQRVAVDLFGLADRPSWFTLYAGGAEAIGDGGGMHSGAFNAHNLGMASFEFLLAAGQTLPQITFATRSFLGTPHFRGILSSVNITNPVLRVPGPVAGAGLPALLALGGFVWARRRKAAAVAAAAA
jgi:hypothetical protein